MVLEAAEREGILIDLELLEDRLLLIGVVISDIGSLIWFYTSLSSKSIVWIILLFLPVFPLWKAVDRFSKLTYNILYFLYLIYSAVICIKFLRIYG